VKAKKNEREKKRKHEERKKTMRIRVFSPFAAPHRKPGSKSKKEIKLEREIE
jgi:hypothetical protein